MPLSPHLAVNWPILSVRHKINIQSCSFTNLKEQVVVQVVIKVLALAPALDPALVVPVPRWEVTMMMTAPSEMDLAKVLLEPLVGHSAEAPGVALSLIHI